jgi:diguanylate cyclase (GGDEF)-like protein
MSLQRRLTLFFILIVILPLAAAGFVVQRVVVEEIGSRAELALDPALDATTALYNERVEALDPRLRASLNLPRFTALLDRGEADAIELFVRRQIDRSPNLDFILAFDRDGDQLAFESSPPRFLPGVDVPTGRQIRNAGEGAGAGFFRTAEIPVRIQGRGAVGSVVGGLWLDQDMLGAASQDNVRLSLVAGETIVASTASLGAAVGVELDLEGPFNAEIGGHSRARARSLGDGITLVASTPTLPIATMSRRVLNSMVALLLVALIGTGLLAFLLARLITQPLEELSEGAQAITEGRYDYRIPIRSKDEVGKLAEVFNQMTDHLSESREDLVSSHDRLQRTVRRIGETLRSTHDMSQMIDSILNTAVEAVDAEAGVLWRLTSTRADVYASAVRGLDPESFGRVRVGDGIVGHVAERATRLLLPSETGAVRPATDEPPAPVVIAIPVYSKDRVTGVLSVYRFDENRPFSEEDFETVVFLAEQGGVAIENVVLHEEAQRLSLMDGLTGTWNRRFFQMQFRQVLATATRFERPFSLLMLDLDNFKVVNDTHGHQRGDAVLVEFAQRVNGALREVDTFARYGGEEFLCLLSETDTDGARITADKIRDVIRAEPFGGAGEVPVKLTVSIGVASYPSHGDAYRGLVEAADQALYGAKAAGRDRVVVAGTPASQLKLAT